MVWNLQNLLSFIPYYVCFNTVYCWQSAYSFYNPWSNVGETEAFEDCKEFEIEEYTKERLI